MQSHATDERVWFGDLRSARRGFLNTSNCDSQCIIIKALIYCGILRLQFYPWPCLHRLLQDRPLFGVGVNLVSSLIVVAEESGVKAVG